MVRNGAVADPASPDPRVVGTRALIELMAANNRLDATALQTVGVKGWDGFALARVIEPRPDNTRPGRSVGSVRDCTCKP